MEGVDRSIVPKSQAEKSKGSSERDAGELPKLAEVLPKSFIEGIVKEGGSYLHRDGGNRFGGLTVGNFEAERLMEEMLVHCVESGDWKPFVLTESDREDVKVDFKRLNDLAQKYEKNYEYSREDAVESLMSSESYNNFRDDYRARHVLNMIAPRRVADFDRDPDDEDRWKMVSWATLNPENLTLELTPYAIDQISKKAKYWEKSKSRPQKIREGFSQMIERVTGKK